MRLIAELSMPNRGSWNGGWTGENSKYTKVFATSKKMESLIGDYRYSFGDGWTARISVRPAEPRERVTNRFAGYEWMISSIKSHGDIRTSN